jgi:hypothetical protein
MTAKKRVAGEEGDDADRIQVLISLTRADFDAALEEMECSFGGDIKIERVGNWSPSIE